MDVKTPKTYEEQVDLIKNKGFLIEDEDREACITFLKQANYYRLSAYFLPFLKEDGTSYHKVNFERIKKIYDFDSHIRIFLLQLIEQIEFYIRTQIAYYLGHKYGALGYLDEKTFSERHNHQKFLENIGHCIKENIHTPVVKHHNEKYSGKFPIWVMIEFFSMGNLSYLYSDLNSKDQKEIAQESFSTTVACLKSWMRCITDLRNRCAHYSRIYYWTFPAVPRMPKNSPYANRIDRKLFAQMLVLKYMFPDKKEWERLVIQDIAPLIISYLPDISLEHIGFPDGWEDLLKAELLKT